MKKKWLIIVSLTLALSLTVGVTLAIAATEEPGEVGISLRIVGPDPTPTPTPTPDPELGFYVTPSSFPLGDVTPSSVIVRYVELVKTVPDSAIVVIGDVPTVPWGNITLSSTSFIVRSIPYRVAITIRINQDAIPGDYNASIWFHR